MEKKTEAVPMSGFMNEAWTVSWLSLPAGSPRVSSDSPCAAQVGPGPLARALMVTMGDLLQPYACNTVQ